MKIEEIENLNFGKILRNQSLKKYTSYRLEETADIMIFPENLKQLINLLTYIKDNNLKYKIIGGGSNLIFEDNYDGIIINLQKFDNLEINDNIVTVEAGYPIIKLSLKTANENLSGLEFASGIPGTIGGAIYNNSGAYKSDIGYVTKSITVLTPKFEIKEMTNREFNFSYRSSFLKEHEDYICLKVTLELKQGNKEEILKIIEDRKLRRIESQPLEYPSAGSVFRNPKDDFAGRLIEESGYKGKKNGGAMVSLKHANFIVNYNKATGKDIVDLISEIKEKVYKKYNVELVLEQEIVK